MAGILRRLGIVVQRSSIGPRVALRLPRGGPRYDAGMRRRLFSIAFLVPATVFAAAASRTVDRVSYTPPAGWTLAAGSDHETWTEIDQAKRRYCQIGVYSNRAGSGDLQAEFAVEWRNLVPKS